MIAVVCGLIERASKCKTRFQHKETSAKRVSAEIWNFHLLKITQKEWNLRRNGFVRCPLAKYCFLLFLVFVIDNEHEFEM